MHAGGPGFKHLDICWNAESLATGRPHWFSRAPTQSLINEAQTFTNYDLDNAETDQEVGTHSVGIKKGFLKKEFGKHCSRTT